MRGGWVDCECDGHCGHTRRTIKGELIAIASASLVAESGGIRGSCGAAECEAASYGTCCDWTAGIETRGGVQTRC